MAFGFLQRLILLLVVMIVVAAVDWWWYRKDAVRWREYLFLLVAGITGDTFGIINDQITAAISPEYFELGKRHRTGAPVSAQCSASWVSSGMRCRCCRRQCFPAFEPASR